MNAFFLFITCFSSSRATGRQPFFRYTFSGARNHSMFSLLSATVLMFSRCFTPTFSDTELPPQEPQPSVSDGLQLEVVQIADAALRGGRVDQDTAGLHPLAANSSIFACSVTGFR